MKEDTISPGTGKEEKPKKTVVDTNNLVKALFAK